MFIYFHVLERQNGRRKDKRGISYPPAYSPDAHIGQGWARRNPRVWSHPRPLRKCQGPTLSRLLAAFPGCISKKLDQKRNSWDLNQGTLIQDTGVPLYNTCP